MFTHFYAGYDSSQPGSTAFTHNDNHQPHGTDLIGRPIVFAHGQFAGSTIRAELREVQQAHLGRKYARVDRRPLDPPPVVQLRLFEVNRTGTEQEVEKEMSNYEDVQLLGLVCTVDLFPVPSLVKSSSKSEGKRKTKSLTSMIQPSHPLSTPSSSRLSLGKQQPLIFTSPDPYSPHRSIDDAMMASPTLSASSLSDYRPEPDVVPSSASDVVHRVDNQPIQESSKVTSALVGATFVQPAIIDYQGKKSILFVFADLAVKIEGSFILRYRFFDLFSRQHNCQDLAIQAECYGGAFHVYSTKEFPGLQASTELTKHLARWGVRLNTRETERRRRKKGEGETHDTPGPRLFSGTKKRKWRDTEGDLESDDHEE